MSNAIVATMVNPPATAKIQYRTQKYTSRNTSTNSTKLPAIYNKIDWEALKFFVGKSRFNLVDYGAGRFTDHIREFVESKGGYYFSYDPFHGRDNWIGRALIVQNIADVVICSNVFNIICEDEIIKEIHELFFSFCPHYFISVYEGDRSGKGVLSKPDCWQRNQRTQEYLVKEYCEAIRKRVICKENNLRFIK